MTMPVPGDFGITPGGGPAMWLVRHGTFSRYGHAAEVVDARRERPDAPGSKPEVLIVEATPRGVQQRWVALDAFRWSTGGPLDAQLTPEIRANLVRRAYGTLNRGYDWPSIAEFIPRFFFSNFRGRSGDHPDDRLFCSELVVWNRREEGIDMFPKKAPGSISPGMLEKFCPKSPTGKP